MLIDQQRREGRLSCLEERADRHRLCFSERLRTSAPVEKLQSAQGHRTAQFALGVSSCLLGPQSQRSQASHACTCRLRQSKRSRCQAGRCRPAAFLQVLLLLRFQRRHLDGSGRTVGGTCCLFGFAVPVPSEFFSVLCPVLFAVMKHRQSRCHRLSRHEGVCLVLDLVLKNFFNQVFQGDNPHVTPVGIPIVGGNHVPHNRQVASSFFKVRQKAHQPRFAVNREHLPSKKLQESSDRNRGSGIHEEEVLHQQEPHNALRSVRVKHGNARESSLQNCRQRVKVQSLIDVDTEHLLDRCHTFRSCFVGEIQCACQNLSFLCFQNIRLLLVMCEKSLQLILIVDRSHFPPQGPVEDQRNRFGHNP
mmetsp:Transcript_23389/g.46022  ORF Transcript_23389/g.46022 Transcript_23389/m.46022 type:complete len:362 (-) Transcript_23389:216-1301(-)